MCLGIPGRIVAVDAADPALATIEVAGVRRSVNVLCVQAEGEPPEALIGVWVLIHVGFAMSRIDEAEAAATLALLAELGELEAEGAAA